MIGAAKASAVVEASSPAASTADIVREVLGGMMLEISFAVFFLLGFVVLRLDKAVKSRRSGKPVVVSSAFAGKMKQIRADYDSGQLSAVVATWREVSAAQFTERCPVDVLRMVMQAILAEGA